MGKELNLFPTEKYIRVQISESILLRIFRKILCDQILFEEVNEIMYIELLVHGTYFGYHGVLIQCEKLITILSTVL